MRYVATTSFTDTKDGQHYTFKNGGRAPADVPASVIAEWKRLGFIVEDTPPVAIAQSLLAAEDLPDEGEEAAVAPKSKPKKSKQ
jgi:hypothetical protein